MRRLPDRAPDVAAFRTLIDAPVACVAQRGHIDVAGLYAATLAMLVLVAVRPGHARAIGQAPLAMHGAAHVAQALVAHVGCFWDGHTHA